MSKKMLSYSAVDMGLNCLRRYYRERILKIRPPQDMTALTTGLVFHDVFNDLGTAGGCSELIKVQTAAQAAIAKHRKALEGIKCDESQLFDDIVEQVAVMRDGPVRLLSADGLTPLMTGLQPACELKFWDEGRGYMGYIDLVSANLPIVDETGAVISFKLDTPCVIDWKILTGKRRRSARDARFSPQLALYALEADVTHAGFVEIPRDLSKPIRTRVVEYTDKELRHWEIWLKAQYDAIVNRPHEEKNWPMCARSNPLCSMTWCPHYFACYPGETK